MQVVQAYVNDGRWIAKCPGGHCPHYWEIFPEDPFLRCLCGTEAGVQFPPEREEILAVLNVREVQNRHWRPGETVTDLKIENAAHQIEATA